MIKKLLEHSYPVEFNLNSMGVSVNIVNKSGSYSFTDTTACERCHQVKSERSDCNKLQLNVDFGNKLIAVLNFEEYIKQFDNTPAAIGERCDYLFVDDTEDHAKIAFCDLSCIEEKWVEPNQGSHPEGKRAKVARQMVLSIEALLKSPLLAGYILTFASKVCIFGWREYGVPDAPVQAARCNVVQNLLAFGTTPSSMTQQLTTKQPVVGHNFNFVQVKYPSVYRW